MEKENKIEIHRIKKGLLKTEKYKIPFDFGLVYEIAGFIEVELYTSEIFDISTFSRNDEIWNYSFNALCLVEDNTEIELHSLTLKEIISDHSKISLFCYGYIIHTKENKFAPDLCPDIESQSLYYLELEGLKMEFTDITKESRTRKGQEIKSFNNTSRDHSSTLLVVDNYPYNQVFFKNKLTRNIFVSFPSDNNNKLKYSTFLKFKKEYISLLSFLNGAEVRIKREFTGAYYSSEKPNSQKIYTYSFNEISNRRFNNFIPINHYYFRKDFILNQVFSFCFDKFRQWNSQIDLVSILFYICNSEQAKSMQEKFFIQMIAFERLTTTYAEYKGKTEEFIPSHDEFKEIKRELLSIIDKHRALFGSSYHTVKSKIGNLNQIKRLSTTEKMYNILSDFSIEISADIRHLIDIVRHKTIHKGEMGEGEEGMTNFILLDELIREIILRMIEYKGPRNSRLLLTNELDY